MATEKSEFKLNPTPASSEIIEFVGSINKEDVENGSVLIFRINTQSYPSNILNEVTASIKSAVKDLFDGQVKAIIIPDTIEVTILKDLLKDHVEGGE